MFAYAVANNRSVQQKKMERYESAAKRKILFDTRVQNNKKLKMTEMEITPEKPYYTRETL
jgi:nicotinic acid mononucleotide adenylyltransferase